MYAIVIKIKIKLHQQMRPTVISLSSLMDFGIACEPSCIHSVWKWAARAPLQSQSHPNPLLGMLRCPWQPDLSKLSILHMQIRNSGSGFRV